MKTVLIVVLLALPFVGGCVKANPPTDTGDSGITTPTTPTSPTTPTTPTSPTSPTTTTTLAYNPDIKALMQADCISCHPTSGRADGNYRVGTYAQVMTAVQAGRSSSRLVTTTQSGGSMYRYWSGSTSTRQTKAATIRSWVVDYNAQENR